MIENILQKIGIEYLVLANIFFVLIAAYNHDGFSKQVWREFDDLKDGIAGLHEKINNIENAIEDLENKLD